MKKLLLTLLASLSLLVSLPSASLAAPSPQDLTVSIHSPAGVKDYPGLEATVEATVTNQSNHPVTNVMAYITMADLTKHWTVNLEDYSADQPVTIGTLQPNESKKVSLPIRFVYVSRYHLYVTAVSDELPNVVSSQAIPVEIMGNTKMDTGLVQVVAVVEPVVLLALLGYSLVAHKRRERKQGDSTSNL